MTGQVEKSNRANISTPLSFKRATTTASATDSSTASSVEDAVPNTFGTPPRRSRRNTVRFRDCTDSSSKTNCSKSKTNKRNRQSRSRASVVSFGDVTVRVYDRSLGDWWDIPHGLSLGWEYKEMPAVPLSADHDSTKNKSKLTKAISKAKAKLTAWFLVNRHKRNSTGIINGDDVFVYDRKPTIRTKKREKRNAKKEKATRKLSYEDCKSTPKNREALLKRFGFTSKELDDSEKERQLLRFEYSHWTCSNSTRPSTLFLQRCLADSECSTSPDQDTTCPEYEPSAAQPAAI